MTLGTSSSSVTSVAAIPSEQPSEQTVPGPRERILTAARDLFFSHGYRATSMSRIADAAQMTTPNLYWHFPSKQDLLGAVLREVYRSFLDELAEAVPFTGSPDERLRAYIWHYVSIQLRDTTEDMTHGYHTLASSLKDDDQAQLAEIRRTIHHMLRDIVTDGIEAGLFHVTDLTSALTAVESACEYTFTWYHPSGRLHRDEIAAGYVEVALRIVGFRKQS